MYTFIKAHLWPLFTLQENKFREEVINAISKIRDSGILQVVPSAISGIDDRQCVICEYYHSLKIFNHMAPVRILG